MIKSKVNENNKAILLLGFAFFFACSTYSLKVIVSKIGFPALESIASASIYVIWLYNLYRFVKGNIEILKRVVISELIYFTIILLNSMLFSNTIPYFRENFAYIRQIIIVYIPCGAVLSCVSEFDNWVLKLRNIAIISSIIMYISWFCGYATKWTAQLYGAQLVPLFLILVYCYIKNHNLINLLFALLDFVFLLNSGRQSLVIAVVGVIFLNIQNISNTRKKIVRILLLSIIIILFYLCYDILMSVLSSIVNIFDIDSRAINMLVNGEFNDTSTRNIIYKTCAKGIKERGFSINGLFGDRIYLNSVAGWMRYPHNIYYEILLDFGILLGNLIVIVFIIFTLRKIIEFKGDKRELFSFILLITIIRLFVSSSFMIEGNFYILVVFSLWCGNSKKKKEEVINESRNINIPLS